MPNNIFEKKDVFLEEITLKIITNTLLDKVILSNKLCINLFAT